MSKVWRICFVHIQQIVLYLLVEVLRVKVLVDFVIMRHPAARAVVILDTPKASEASANANRGHVLEFPQVVISKGMSTQNKNYYP